MAVNTSEIWQEFSDSLKGFILKRVQDEHVAEDILQGIFIKIHNNIDSLKDETRLQAWVYQIARNGIIDHYRHQKSADAPEGILDYMADEPVTGEDVGSEVAALCLKPMVNRLSEKYRQAIILTEFEGLTQNKMAEKLGLSLSGAKSRVQRAKGNLKDMLLRCCHFEFDRLGNIFDYQVIKQNCCDSCSCEAEIRE